MNYNSLVPECYRTVDNPKRLKEAMTELVTVLLIQAILDGHPRSPLITKNKPSDDDLDNYITARKFILDLCKEHPAFHKRVLILWNLRYRDARAALGIRYVMGDERAGVKDDESPSDYAESDGEDWT